MCPPVTCEGLERKTKELRKDDHTVPGKVELHARAPEHLISTTYGAAQVEIGMASSICWADDMITPVCPPLLHFISDNTPSDHRMLSPGVGVDLRRGAKRAA